MWLILTGATVVGVNEPEIEGNDAVSFSAKPKFQPTSVSLIFPANTMLS